MGQRQMATTRFAQNDLARLSYEVAGPAHGPVVVLLHATLGDRISLRPLRERLEGQAKVILADARGHGASSGLAGRTLSSTDLANDVVAILEAEEVTDAVHLVGHGQGAISALELAHWSPDRIASMVLIEPDALSILEGEADDAVSEAREGARKANREAADHSYKGLADKALNRYLDRRWGQGWQDRLTKPRLAAVRRSVQALSASLDAEERFRILPEHLEALASPVLVVTGEDSPEAEQHIADRIASWIPGSDRLVVESLPGGAPFSPSDGGAAGPIADWVLARFG
ncbi:MAG TPA: alpha/beta fold hydrolase [Thermomicrobiales bacterium]|nr:alpha/beta fold hydrolase [Thermomicrobiales bacterium]